MGVSIKLQFGLEKYERLHRNDFILERADETNIERLIEILGIPAEYAKIILINGKPISSSKDMIHDGDCITIFPPICGG